MTDGRDLVIFDVCDTLYSANTTMGFIQIVCAGSRRKRALHALLNSRRLPVFWLLAVFSRLTGLDVARQLNIQLLRRMPQDKVQAQARRYVTQTLAQRKIAQVHDALALHKARGARICLVSASLDIVIAEIAQTLGVDWRATVLSMRDHHATGHLTYDLTGAKLSVVEAMLAGSGAQTKLIVYTDNLSDMPLVRRASEAFVILKKPDDRRKWGDVRATFIQATP
jgi:HAD superfamily phosphoserine phosphatase-like hydrolase